MLDAIEPDVQRAARSPSTAFSAGVALVMLRQALHPGPSVEPLYRSNLLRQYRPAQGTWADASSLADQEWGMTWHREFADGVPLG